MTTANPNACDLCLGFGSVEEPCRQPSHWVRCACGVPIPGDAGPADAYELRFASPVVVRAAELAERARVVAWLRQHGPPLRPDGSPTIAERYARAIEAGEHENVPAQFRAV